MPKVPTINQQRVSSRAVNPQLENEVPSLEAFGGGQVVSQVANATQGMLQQASKVAVTEMQKAEDAKFSELKDYLTRIETNQLYDDDIGALNKKGKQAFDADDAVLGYYDNEVARVEESLSPRLKERFREYARNKRTSMDRILTRHISSESLKYEEDTKLSVIENERNKAISAFDDDISVNESLQSIEDEVVRFGKRNGYSEERIQAELSEELSKTHKGVINQYLAGGADLFAKEYYDKHKDKIAGKYRAGIEKSLEIGNLRGKAQKESDKIFQESGENLGAALERARGIEDPKLRDEVVSRVKGLYSDKKAADRANKESTYELLNDKLVASGGDIDSIEPEMLSGLSAREERDLRAYAADLRQGKDAPRNSPEFYELDIMASTQETREKFKSINLTDPKYRRKIHPSDLSKLMNIQRGLREGDQKTLKLLDGIETKNSIIKSSLQQAGIDTSSKADEESVKARNKFKREVDKRVVERQAALNREVTNEELREISDNLMAEVITDEGFSRFIDWFGFTEERKRVFELTPEEEVTLELEGVPDNEKEKITSTLRKLNRPATEENILKMYSEKIRRMRSR